MYVYIYIHTQQSYIYTFTHGLMFVMQRKKVDISYKIVAKIGNWKIVFVILLSLKESFTSVPTFRTTESKEGQRGKGQWCKRKENLNTGRGRRDMRRE